MYVRDSCGNWPGDHFRVQPVASVVVQGFGTSRKLGVT